MTMMNDTLSGPEHPPHSGGDPKQLIVLLHGVGADGEDLTSLAPMLGELFPDAHFISPDAPQACDMAPMGFQWFSLQDRDPHVMLQGIKETAPILNDFLDEQLKKHGLSDKDLVLIGFSQGTMMSLYTALRRENACAGIIGFSGALMGGELLQDELKSSPPVCLVHGNADMVVHYDAMAIAESQLQAAGVEVETHTCEGLGHGIDPMGMTAAVKFLKKILPESSEA